MAAPLEAVAKAHPDLSLGSYPFFSPAGYGSQLVIRGRDLSQVEQARRDLEAALAGTGLDVETTDTHAGGSRLDEARCAQLVAEKLDQFGSSMLVVTDRLHGMILSVLAGTPCLVVPNANHKIKQTWFDWLSDQPQVNFLSPDGFGTLPERINALLAAGRRNPGTAPIDPSRYDSLRQALPQAGGMQTPPW